MVCPLRDSGGLLLRCVGARRVGDVQAAFLLLRLLPPPAPGTLRFARHEGTGARRATDRQKAPLMQRIARHVVGAREFARALACPIEKRIDLDQAALIVELSKKQLGTVGGLIGAQPGDPGSGAMERSRQRRDLANGATVEASLDGGSEAIDALSGDQRFDGAVFGREGQDADAVTPLGLRPDVIGFGEKPAGIERRDLYGKSLREYRMRNGLILYSEACREYHAAGNLGADRREAFKQIERGKAFHKSAGDGCKY